MPLIHEVSAPAVIFSSHTISTTSVKSAASFVRTDRSIAFFASLRGVPDDQSLNDHFGLK